MGSRTSTGPVNLPSFSGLRCTPLYRWFGYRRYFRLAPSNRWFGWYRHTPHIGCLDTLPYFQFGWNLPSFNDFRCTPSLGFSARPDNGQPCSVPPRRTPS